MTTFAVRPLLGGTLLAATVLLLIASTAQACTVVPLTPAHQRRNADVIFTGTAIRVDRPALPSSSRDGVKWTFQVDAMDKGRDRAQVEIVTASSGASCGFAFELGARYRVLGAWNGEPSLLWTGLGSGNEQVDRLPVTPRIEGEFAVFVLPLSLSVPQPMLVALPVLVIAGGVFLLVRLLRRTPTTEA